MMAWIRNLAVVRYFVLASIFFLSALALNGNAQTFRGTILGTVTDSSGAAISGATVPVKNTGTGFVRRVTTDDDGNYSPRAGSEFLQESDCLVESSFAPFGPSVGMEICIRKWLFQWASLPDLRIGQHKDAFP